MLSKKTACLSAVSIFAMLLLTKATDPVTAAIIGIAFFAFMANE